jgi:hypothetical protein
MRIKGTGIAGISIMTVEYGRMRDKGTKGMEGIGIMMIETEFRLLKIGIQIDIEIKI